MSKFRVTGFVTSLMVRSPVTLMAVSPAAVMSVEVKVMCGYFS